MTAATGITDEQLEALRSGGWSDDDVRISPGWGREVLVRGDWEVQVVFPDHGESRWRARSGSSLILLDSLEEVLKWCDKWCDELASGLPPDTGAVTKQEERFALIADG